MSYFWYWHYLFLSMYITYICTHAQLLSRVQLFATPWAVANQALLSRVFFRQEYWSGLPFLPPGDLPDPEIKLMSPALQCLLYWQVDSLLLSHWGHLCVCVCVCVCVYIYMHMYMYVCVHAKSFQSCSTLCDPIDCSLAGFSVHGILQARIL